MSTESSISDLKFEKFNHPLGNRSWKIIYFSLIKISLIYEPTRSRKQMLQRNRKKLFFLYNSSNCIFHGLKILELQGKCGCLKRSLVKYRPVDDVTVQYCVGKQYQAQYTCIAYTERAIRQCVCGIIREGEEKGGEGRLGRVQLR